VLRAVVHDVDERVPEGFRALLAVGADVGEVAVKPFLGETRKKGAQRGLRLGPERGQRRERGAVIVVDALTGVCPSQRASQACSTPSRWTRVPRRLPQGTGAGATNCLGVIRVAVSRMRPLAQLW
jgi:hypothetical protein